MTLSLIEFSKNYEKIIITVFLNILVFFKYLHIVNLYITAFACVFALCGITTASASTSLLLVLIRKNSEHNQTFLFTRSRLIINKIINETNYVSCL